MKMAHGIAPDYWHYWSWKSERGSMGSRTVRDLLPQVALLLTNSKTLVDYFI